MASPNPRAKGVKSESLTAPPFDYEKETGVSKDDPRSEKTQWPCYGKHIESPQSSNGFAGWKSCVVCGMRVSYVPRQGYHGKSAAQVNPVIVKKALEKLQADLPTGR